MRYLQIRNFPVCCSADIIGYFGFSTTNINSRGERPLADLEKDLIEADKMDHVGLRCAVINEEQIPHVEYLLEKFGYEPLVKDFLGDHNKKCTLYAKVYRKAPTAEIGKLKYHGKDKRINHETPREAAPTKREPVRKKAAEVAPIVGFRNPAVDDFLDDWF